MRSRNIRLMCIIIAIGAFFALASIVYGQGPMVRSYGGSLGPGTSDYSPAMGKYYRVWNFSLNPNTRYTFDLTSQYFDTYLILRDSSGREIARDDDGGQGLNARLVFVPSYFGTFQVVATSYPQNATGPFTLTMTQLPIGGPIPPPPPVPNRELTLLGRVNVGPELWLRPGSFYTRHNVTFGLGQIYSIEVNTTGRDSFDPNWFDPMVYVVDQYGTVVAQDDDSGGGLNARINGFVPQPGRTYSVIVTTFARQATGSYVVRIRW